tara:strand:+ start:897 stop:1268 length:372 start_codon:yes stop_codon:yes gene_type:complete
MKTLFKWAILCSLTLGLSAFAGPPKDSVTIMRPYPSICTPGLESLMLAMTIDYAVHVSATFKESKTTYVMIVENPNTRTMAVVHVNMDGKACLVFSGDNLRKFERPEGMAPPMVDLNEEGDGV